MKTFEIELNGHTFEITKFKGREAMRMGFKLVKLSGGAITTFARDNDLKYLFSVAKGFMKSVKEETKEGDVVEKTPAEMLEGVDSFKIDLASSVDYLFNTMSEEAMEALVYEFLDKINVDKCEFTKVWDEKFEGDAGIALNLFAKSLELNFGFFSKILTGLAEKAVK